MMDLQVVEVQIQGAEVLDALVRVYDRMILQKILRPEVMEVQIQGAEVLVWVREADAPAREADALVREEGPEVE